MLRDLISLDIQSKFIKSNVPELKIEYHSRNVKLQPPPFKPDTIIFKSRDQQQELSGSDTFDDGDKGEPITTTVQQ